MTTLEGLRCFNHALREAVARCPECERVYCRECVTEHEHRVLCARCLDVAAEEESRRGGVLRGGARVAAAAVACALAWTFFYLVGAGLLTLPSQFHEDFLAPEPAPLEDRSRS
jgi:hypothetical protein